MKNERNFILVDDDQFNNVIGKMVITHTLPSSQVTIFDQPEACLKYLLNEFIITGEPAILFLDINMPSMSGWEFLKAFEGFSKKLTEKIHIYLLTSSADPCDIARAASEPYIKGFISKPLDPSKLADVS